MNILIYGDSNTWGQIPDINGYCKDAIAKQYDKKDLWWFPLTKDNDVVVNGVPGRAIANDNPWLEGRNASTTIEQDILGLSPELVIVGLGTNDCKNRYNLSAQDIADELEILISFIVEQTGAKIMIVSPPTIKEGNKITDKFYVGGEKKSQELNKTYLSLAKKNEYMFVSGTDLEVGEDGEHLTRHSHHRLGERVMAELERNLTNQNQKI